ncbi:pimeloyl-ACP methyl ester esterase BioH [Methylobacter sp. YRD-M1]|uniref:pimeloyl-ACP methyl ester esterase BioH n=1 Tax=Methylobacter sp. YRD-M1 TaxID=2911520 RepID=UPI00227B5644|nr:pimeloyl-ACP methyl ester esterase BioH [Methylobacter sp. YRD-M1]WAK01333.1 pimeloyl-ACP methyl ester esterase BioH [Methylobacter sp. YRD-M1]
MIKLHSETFGQGAPVVLVHGWAMHSGIWRDFAKALARHCRVTCIDLPGHGRSEKISPFTLEQISLALVNSLPEQPCGWLGWSLGATIVLDIAERFPERVNSLVLLAGNPLFVQTETWPGMEAHLLDAFADGLNDNCQATLLRFLALQVKGLTDYKVILKELRESVFGCDMPDSQVLQSGLDILKHSDLRPALAKLKCPVSVILGGKDALIPVAIGRQLPLLNAGCEVNIIDKAGHVPFLSHQQEVLAIVSRFLGQG